MKYVDQLRERARSFRDPECFLEGAEMVERTLIEALGHLDKVLNGCRTHQEQQASDKDAREFLSLHR